MELSTSTQSNVEFDISPADASTEAAINDFFKSTPETTEPEVKVQPSTTDLIEKNAVPLKTKKDKELVVETDDENTDEQIKEFLEKTETPEEKTEEDPIKKVYKHFAEGGYIDAEDVESFDGSEETFFEHYNKTLENRVKTQIEGFVDSLPEDGKQLLQHLRDGGTIEDFYESRNDVLKDSNIENIDDQKRIIRTWLRINEYTPDEINQELEDYEAIGKTKQKAQIYFEKYKAVRTNEQKRQEQAQQEAQLDAQENYKRTVTQIKDILQKGKVKDMALSKDEAQKVEDYLLKPTVRLKDGRTVTPFQHDQMQDAKDPETLLARAIHSMRRYSIKEIRAAAETEATLSLKKKLAGLGEAKRVPSSSGTSYSKPDINIDWKNVLGKKS